MFSFRIALGKGTIIYCIADDFYKEHELELNKKTLSASAPNAAIEREDRQTGLPSELRKPSIAERKWQMDHSENTA